MCPLAQATLLPPAKSPSLSLSVLSCLLPEGPIVPHLTPYHESPVLNKSRLSKQIGGREGTSWGRGCWGHEEDGGELLH